MTSACPKNRWGTFALSATLAAGLASGVSATAGATGVAGPPATTGVAGVAAATAAQDTVTVVRVSRAAQDTFARAKHPNRAFGAANRLAVGRRATTFLSFKTPQVSETEVVAAKLCLTPRRNASTRLKVTTVEGGWPSAITWMNRPARIAEVRDWAGTVEPMRRKCMRLPAATVGESTTELAIRGARWTSFASRESSPRLAPRLRVKIKGPKKKLDPAPTPAPEPTPSPTPAPEPTPTPTPAPEPTPPPAPEPTPTPTPTPTGKVLWDGSFESGGIPVGMYGQNCGTGDADGPNSSADAYSSVQEWGNSNCSSVVEHSRERVRTPDSRRALKITMGPRQQREQLVSKHSWRADSSGSTDEWYGFSLYYDKDWDLGGGLGKEVSGSAWHNPIAFRTDGPNGSMNFSGDMNLDNANGKPYKSFSTPHMVLRRNTIKHRDGLYKDGLGLDKMDLGPIVTGRWMDFVCHVRWSTTTRNALRECWRDGKYMGAKTSVNAVDTARHTLRVGPYQTTSINHARTTFADNVRVGTSYDAVDPSRAR